MHLQPCAAQHPLEVGGYPNVWCAGWPRHRGLWRESGLCPLAPSTPACAQGRVTERSGGRRAWRAAALSRGRPLVTCCLAASRSTVRGCSPSFAGTLAGRVGVEPVGMGDSLRLVGVSGWGVGLGWLTG
eukprot:scaffold8378_cov54-Phaeocystis_antarctica.AAC.3